MKTIDLRKDVLKLVMSIFDPLGLIANFTIRGRILLQDIWRTGIGWDDSIDEELHCTWIPWLDDLTHNITQLRIPRCYSLNIPKAKRIEMQVFCDASKKAFASVVYIRTLSENGITISLIIAKAKVAPTKPISIPRLELQAAVMGSRLSSCIRRELEIHIDKTYLWTDSTTVLHWINGDGSRLGQFESHRVGEIQELSDVSDWHWVPSKLNAADELGLMKVCQIFNAFQNGQPTVEELSDAEIRWIQQCQRESFLDDIEALKKKTGLSRQSRLKRLSPAIDERGLLVLSGRTDFADSMENTTRRPYILHPKHKFTRLLLQHVHEKFAHQGIESVLNEVRQKFWVIDGRAVVKLAFKCCQKCRNKQATPEVPIMGQLPTERLNSNVKPFTYTGIDYFGPLMVTVGRRREKRWGVIFTCLTMRAVHLEVSHSLTDSAIMAIRRMISSRGLPKQFVSDNGTNFRGADEELRKAVRELDQTKLNQTMTSKGIEWKFIPPGAPHMCGTWERLVRSIKRVFYVILNGQLLKDELLLTLFAEAENIVNSRPLTHVSVDPADPEALTPNHFLLGSSSGEGSPGKFEDKYCFRREWRKSQHFVDNFWRRWIKEYLPTLTRRTKWTDDGRTLKINDIVIIVDENAPRNRWKLGKVTAVFPGPDGKVRVAEVKTQSGTYRRPVTKLCRLDLEDSEENDPVPHDGGEC